MTWPPAFLALRRWMLPVFVRRHRLRMVELAVASAVRGIMNTGAESRII